MTGSHNRDLVKQVIFGARDYGVSTVLFRHAVGETLGVNVTDMECLFLIFFKGIATPAELSRYTGLSSGATTAMLDRLERARLIERRSNPADRRSKHIVISRESAERVAPLFSSVRQAQDRLVSGLSEGELEVLLRFFKESEAMWDEERSKLERRLSKRP